MGALLEKISESDTVNAEQLRREIVMSLFSDLPCGVTDFENLILNQATRDKRGVYGPPTYLNHPGVLLCLLARGLSDPESRVLRANPYRFPPEAILQYQGAHFLVSPGALSILLADGTLDQLDGTDFRGRTRYIINDVGYRQIREWKAGYTV